MGEARRRALAGAGVPLGINAKSYEGEGRPAGGSQRENLSGVDRGVRYRLMSANQRIHYDKTKGQDEQDRVCACHVRRKGADVAVMLDPERRRAHFTGTETCANVWVCPVCSGTIYEERRAQVQAAVNAHKAAGGEVYLATLTFPHDYGDNLEEQRDGLRLALRKFNQCAAYRALKRSAGFIGSIRALEITWGAVHGWHLHAHVLMFAAADKLPALRRALESAWVDAVIAAGLADQNERNKMLTGAGGESPAFDVQNGDFAAEYVAKMGREATLQSKLAAGEAWGAARELVGGSRKKGRAARGVTPFTLLAAYAGIIGIRGVPPGRAMALFLEYSRAMRGQRQLYWSPGLKRTLQLGRLFTDEELAALDHKLPDTVEAMRVAADDWRMVVQANMRDELLLAVERGGGDDGRAFLVALRASRPPLIRPAVDEPRKLWPSRTLTTYTTADGRTGYWMERGR